MNNHWIKANSMRARYLLMGIVGLLGGVGSAQAGSIVVMEAHGAPFKAGQVIDDKRVLDLNAGQSVVLITATGDTVKLRGPYHQRPGAGANGSGNLTIALSALLVHQGVRASDVGAVRAAGPIHLPEPWVIDVSHPGTRCVREGKPIVFWRASAGAASELAIAPVDRAWRLTAAWPQGQDRLAAPDELPVTGRATYLMDIGDGPVAVTMLRIPAVVNTDPMLAAWMFEKGCNLQAETLAQTFK
jgi:hypothetical protein